MKTVTFSLPMMYADHHVTAVHTLLHDFPGIQDLYASSNFHILEVEYDTSEITEEEIREALADAGYLEGITIPEEIGSTPAHESAQPFFRHTAVFTQTGNAISFGQEVPEVERPLWPCPGVDQ